MKNTVAVILLLFLGNLSIAQTLIPPKCNCTNAKGIVRPDDLVSWCHNAEDNYYNACRCECETADKNYKLQKKEIENQIKQLLEEIKDFDDKMQSESHQASNIKFDLEKSEDLEDDKNNAVKLLNDAIKHGEKIIELRNEIYQLKKKIYPNQTPYSNDNLLGTIDGYRTMIEEINNYEKTEKLNISDSNDQTEENSDKEEFKPLTKLDEGKSSSQIAYENNQKIIEQTQEQNQRIDALTQSLTPDLTKIFTGDFKPENMMNITESILNSGVLSSMDAIMGVSTVGAAGTIAVGISQDIKERKIRRNFNQLKLSFDLYSHHMQNFTQAINSNNIGLAISLDLHMREKENTMNSNLDYLQGHSSTSELKTMQSSIIEIKAKREKGIQKTIEEYQKGISSLKTVEDRQKYFSYLSTYMAEKDTWDILFTEEKKTNGIQRREYFSNGNLRLSAFTIDGKNTGEVVQYHYNGELASKTNWIDGKLHGQKTTYYSNGVKKFELDYVYGIGTGLLNEYWENGQLKYSMMTHHNRYDTEKHQLTSNDEYNYYCIDILESYSISGDTLNPGSLKDGNGSVFYYDEFGNKLSHYQFKKGKKSQDLYVKKIVNQKHTASYIVEQYFKALGGRKQLEKVKSLTFVGESVECRGCDKWPDALEKTIGDTVIILNSWEKRKNKQELIDLRKLNSTPFPLLSVDFTNATVEKAFLYGYVYGFGKRSKYIQRDVYKVIQLDMYGKKNVYYFDFENYLLLGEATHEVVLDKIKNIKKHYGQYEVFDGLLLPTKINAITSSKWDDYKYIIDEISIIFTD